MRTLLNSIREIFEATSERIKTGVEQTIAENNLDHKVTIMKTAGEAEDWLLENKKDLVKLAEFKKKLLESF